MNTDTANFAGHIPGRIEYNASITTQSKLDRMLLSMMPSGATMDVGSEGWVEARVATIDIFNAAPDLLRERNELRAMLESLTAGDPSIIVMSLDRQNAVAEVLARCGK